MPSIFDTVDKQRNRTRPRMVNRTPELDKAGRQSNYPWVVPVDKGYTTPADRLSGEGPRPDADYRNNNEIGYMVRRNLSAGSTKSTPDNRPVYGPENLGLRGQTNRPAPPVQYNMSGMARASGIAPEYDMSGRLNGDNRPALGPENRSWIGRQWDSFTGFWKPAFEGSPTQAAAATTAAAAGTGVKPKPSGSEQALSARTAAIASPGKIDYNKPFWWMDESLGDRQPIHAIRGTKQTWYSPQTGLEFNSPQEAYEGVPHEEKVVLAEKLAERLHEVRIAGIEGGSKIKAAEASGAAWKNLPQTGLDGEAMLYNTDTAEVKPARLAAAEAAVSEKDLERSNRMVAEASALNEMTDDEALKALVQIDNATNRALTFEALSRMHPNKAKSIAQKAVEVEKSQRTPIFNDVR